MAITNKGLRTGLNAWVEAAAEWGYQRGLLFGIASPKGRRCRRSTLGARWSTSVR